MKTSIRTEEAAKYLGISVSHLNKLAAKKKIKFTKPNGKIRFFRQCDLDDYMVGKINDAEFLTVKEAQEITGLSEKTIIGLSEQDLIPNWKRRGEYFYQRVELNLWVEEYKKRGIIK